MRCLTVPHGTATQRTVPMLMNLKKLFSELDLQRGKKQPTAPM